jgi:hypothetical protein
VAIVGDADALVAAARGKPVTGRLDVSGRPEAIAQFAAAFGLPDAPPPSVR